MKALTKQEFIKTIVDDEMSTLTVLSTIDKAEKSEQLFSLVGQMGKTFDIFGLEKPNYLNSWTLHDEIVDALCAELSEMKERNTDDGRG